MMVPAACWHYMPLSLKSIHSLDFEQRLFIGLDLSSVFSED